MPVGVYPDFKDKAQTLIHPAKGLSKNKYDAKGNLRPQRKTRSKLVETKKKYGIGDTEDIGDTIRKRLGLVRYIDDYYGITGEDKILMNEENADGLLSDEGRKILENYRDVFDNDWEEEDILGEEGLDTKTSKDDYLFKKGEISLDEDTIKAFESNPLSKKSKDLEGVSTNERIRRYKDFHHFVERGENREVKKERTQKMIKTTDLESGTTSSMLDLSYQFDLTDEQRKDLLTTTNQTRVRARRSDAGKKGITKDERLQARSLIDDFFSGIEGLGATSYEQINSSASVVAPAPPKQIGLMAQQSVGATEFKKILPPITEEGIVLPKKVMMKIKRPPKIVGKKVVFKIKKKSTQNE